MNYQEFLQNKGKRFSGVGLDIQPHNFLYEWQRLIIGEALKKERFAIWADCGLGKTPMQLSWAQKIVETTGKKVLIVAPLAVSLQTVHEAEKFGIMVKYSRGKEVDSKIIITNYEMLEHFSASDFIGVVLDESSILKNYSGKIRNLIIEMFSNTPYRLACTATPSPNDFMEIGNHSEFLGIMKRTEMLSNYFVHDGGETSKWRLKGHAEGIYWDWIATWAIVISKPSDIGFEDGGFKLPQLNYNDHFLDSDVPTEGYLISMPAISLGEQRKVKSVSVESRVQKAVNIVGGIKQSVVVWCELNREGDLLESKLKGLGAVQISGADSIEEKEKKLIGFSNGDIRILITKTSIAGFGLNWQHCHNAIYVNVTHSYEDLYQSVRRFWRFGQKKPVNIHRILLTSEQPILANIERKHLEAERMKKSMIEVWRKKWNTNLSMAIV